MDVKFDVKSHWGDKRKIYVAWIDDKKFEETQKNPDQKIKISWRKIIQQENN